jgi:hypothetical protein
MKPIIVPPLPRKRSKKRRRSNQRLCDCGRPARYKQRVMLYHADLVTEVHTTIDLCETCFLLECDLHLARGQTPPKGARIG